MKLLKGAPNAGRFTGLLTDLDGTLVNSQDAICDALFECFAYVGARVPEKQEIMDMFGLPVEVMLMRLGNVAPTQKDVIDQFICEYKRQYPAYMARSATFIDNAESTIHSIARAGHPICLITSERRANAQFTLNRLRLSESVRYLVSRDDVTNFKPDPEPLIKAMALINRRPEQCVYIGESPFDIDAGVKSGAYVAAIASGNWSVESLLDCKPDILLDDISELLALFDLFDAKETKNKRRRKL